VIPAARKARAAFASTNQRSASGRGPSPWSGGGGPNPGLRSVSLRTWVCASISPGRIVRPATSIAPDGFARPSTRSIAAMRPSTTRTTTCSIGGPPRPSIRRASHRISPGVDTTGLPLTRSERPSRPSSPGPAGNTSGSDPCP
jgi:hypothetical protein